LIERQGKLLVAMRGDRSRQSAKKNFGASLPSVYRQYAVVYTDFWESYKTVIPSKRHRPLGKETGQTNPIERLNNTFRQRISRLVRESLSFSKKMENHVGEPFGILSMTTMHSKAKD
jgi:insertion element IS1 protein InsB